MFMYHSFAYSLTRIQIARYVGLIGALMFFAGAFAITTPVHAASISTNPAASQGKVVVDYNQIVRISWDMTDQPQGATCDIRVLRVDNTVRARYALENSGLTGIWDHIATKSGTIELYCKPSPGTLSYQLEQAITLEVIIPPPPPAPLSLSVSEISRGDVAELSWDPSRAGSQYADRACIVYDKVDGVSYTGTFIPRTKKFSNDLSRIRISPVSSGRHEYVLYCLRQLSSFKPRDISNNAPNVLLAIQGAATNNASLVESLQSVTLDVHSLADEFIAKDDAGNKRRIFTAGDHITFSWDVSRYGKYQDRGCAWTGSLLDGDIEAGVDTVSDNDSDVVAKTSALYKFTCLISVAFRASSGSEIEFIDDELTLVFPRPHDITSSSVVAYPSNISPNEQSLITWIASGPGNLRWGRNINTTEARWDGCWVSSPTATYMHSPKYLQPPSGSPYREVYDSIDGAGVNWFPGEDGDNRTFGYYAVIPDQTTTYKLYCYRAEKTDPTDSGVFEGPEIGPSEIANGVVTVVPPPIVTLSVQPTKVVSGSSVKLSWSSQHATWCGGNDPENGQFITGGRVSGSVDVFPTKQTTYTLKCTNSLVKSATTFVTVPVVPPTATVLTASETVIDPGKSIKLTWNSPDATSCKGTNFSTAKTSTGFTWTGWRLQRITVTSYPKSGSVFVTPTADSTTYTVTCTKEDPVAGTVTVGTDDETVTLKVYPAPTVSLSLAPATVVKYDAVTMTWGSTNADRCHMNFYAVVDGQNTLYRTTDMSDVPSPTSFQLTDVGDFLYQLVCEGKGGMAHTVAPLSVFASALPEPTLTVNPAVVAPGEPVDLIWESLNAVSCNGTNFTTNGAVSGNVQVVPETSTTYTLTCTGPGGSGSSSAGAQTASDIKRVTVSLPLPIPVMSAAPGTIRKGGLATLTWSSMNADSCTGVNFNTFGATAGSVSVSPDLTLRYTLTCENAGGSAQDDQFIFVVDPSISLPSLPSSGIIRVLKGTRASIEWSSQDAQSCQLLDDQGSVVKSGKTGIEPTKVITEQTTYTVSCTTLLGDTIDKTITITPFLPVFQEF